MFADQQRRIGSVGAPAHRLVEEWPIRKVWQERLDCSFDGELRLVGVGIGGMFGVGAGHGNAFGSGRAERLVLLEAGEAWKLVADLDDAVPICSAIL